MSPQPDQTLIVQGAEIKHDPNALSPKAIAAAVGALLALVLLNALVALLTGDLTLATVAPSVGTAAAAVIAAYIKREIIPELEVAIPDDIVALAREEVETVTTTAGVEVGRQSPVEPPDALYPKYIYANAEGDQTEVVRALRFPG